MRKILIILFALISSTLYSQEIDISEALKHVESGNIQGARELLEELKKKSPNDPSVIFLEGVLTFDGESALNRYTIVYEKYPKSRFADASIYRIFSYYYALGLYNKAESYLDKLKNEYPNSPYIKSADRTIPDEEENISDEQPNQDETDYTKNYNYTVQAGAFLNIENAKKLTDQLNADGYPTEIITKEIGGSIFNVVNTGKFINEDEIKTLINHLEKKYSVKGRVIQLNN